VCSSDLTRTEKGWSQPQPFSKPINSEFREAGHALTLDRTLYFSTGLPQDKGCDVYRTMCVNETYTMAEYVPNLSTSADEDGVWVSPDGKYLFFTGNNGKNMDIYWIRVDNIIADLKKEVFASN
jgi:hypothetical protein